MTTADARGTRLGVGGALLALAVLLVAVNLRAPLVAVSSVVDRIGADLRLSPATAGLLTSLPVLCFAAASPPASWLIGRVGVERAMVVGLAVLGTGVVVRSLDGAAAAMAGTVLVGSGITVGNVVIPVVIGRDFPHRSGTMLAAYTGTMNAGSMLTLVATVPLADALGSPGGWRWALALWAIVTGVAALVWWAATRGGPAPTPEGAGSGGAAHRAGSQDGPRWWRRGVVWALLAAFGLQAFSYYGVTAWLPEILGDRVRLGPSAAGAAASLFQVAAIVGAVGVPLLRSWTGSLRAAFAVVALCWLALPVGLLLAPGGWALWCTVGGVAQGGGFTAIIAAVIASARDSVENRRMSTLVQGGGYVLAALGPALLGGLYDLAGGWVLPLATVTGALVGYAVAGLFATAGVGRR